MKHVKNLSFTSKLKTNIAAKSGLIQVVLGPRQVGKTTTVLRMIEDHYADSALYVSADSIFNAEAQWLREQWQKALREDKILFIDEIQKCHNWAEAIKSLYDETKRSKKNLQCVLLGSSSLAIQKGLSESLTGRFQILRAYHWNFDESKRGYELSFDDYLRYGGYPGSYQFIHDDDEWAQYVANSIVQTVVEKDILQYNTVKSPALFKQTFEIIMSYPAQEISYTKLLGQIQDKGNVELVKYYIQLFEGAFLLKALEKFSAKAVLTKASSPKILPLAPSLAYLQIRAPYEEQERGRIFETIVGGQLVRTGEKLTYWREGSLEVDFVLSKGRNIWAIEVKSGRKKSAKSLGLFKQKFPQAKSCIISPENYLEFEKDPMMFLQKSSG